jgi:predicted lipoprotein
MPSVPSSPPALLAALATLAISVAACERVSYWSSAEEDQADAIVGPGVGNAAVGPGATVTVSVGTGTEILPATKGDVLAAVSACAIELYGEFGARAEALLAATATAADTGADADRDAARTAWLAAMDTWQQAELIRVGPAGPATLPEGRSFREDIYSWPLTSRCLVDQTTVSRSYEADDFASDSLVNVRGLAAAEYLLFYDGTDNGCGSGSSINATGSWNAISPSDLHTRKADYAHAVAVALDARAADLVIGWSRQGGDFGGLLASAGSKGSPFTSDQSAIDAVGDGLFYLEKQVKDMKVGKPLGIIDCEEATCLDAVESPFARRSARHVRNNLIGFQRIFSGCEAADGVGFDDLLATAGAPDLGATMQADLRAAITAAEALEEEDLAAAIQADRPSVEALHAAIKKLTDELKADVVSLLDLTPPDDVEGDND